MTFGSLFAGIGGFDLGLERAGMECRWQVEIDDYAQRVLAKHWPNVQKYRDIRDIKHGDLEPVDLVCGGFPCQDISYAGKGAGIEGARSGLWSEFARVIRMVRPRFVLVENVPALLGRGLWRVLGDLAESGYDAEWDCIPAGAFGAHFIGERVFIVAGCAKTCFSRRKGVWPNKVRAFTGDEFARLVESELRLCVPVEQPLRWRKPRRVFTNSMSDLFHEDVTDEQIDEIFAVMTLAVRHTFQILTKRPKRMLAYCSSNETVGRIAQTLAYLTDKIQGAKLTIRHNEDGLNGILVLNVWLGVSIEDQKAADERIPLLLQTPAAVRFVSAEPLLGSIDFAPPAGPVYRFDPDGESPERERMTGWFPHIDWVIVGGESGPKARPMDLAWARSIVEGCRNSGIPCFVKQLGREAYEESGLDDIRYVRFRDRKGGDPSEWPEDLRVREFPA